MFSSGLECGSMQVSCGRGAPARGAATTMMRVRMFRFGLLRGLRELQYSGDVL